MLQFTAPAFVILLMALIYHQKPDRADLMTCIPVSQKFILPGDYVLRSDLTDDALSEYWNQLALNVALVCQVLSFSLGLRSRS